MAMIKMFSIMQLLWLGLVFIHSERTELDQRDLNLYGIAQDEPFMFFQCKSELQDLWIGVLRGELKNCVWMLLKTYTGLLHKKNAFESAFNKSLGNSDIEFSLLVKVTLI